MYDRIIVENFLRRVPNYWIVLGPTFTWDEWNYGSIYRL